MPKRMKQSMNRPEPVTIRLDDELLQAYPGETLASAIINGIGIGYRETRNGEKRGPICNMGVCYECSVHVEGRGNVRACMTQVEAGMIVSTNTTDIKQDKGESQDKSQIQKNRRQPSDERTRYDVVIIGAGPAGMGAVDELAGHGLRIAVLDEQGQAGGQIYRQPPREFAPGTGRHKLIESVLQHPGIDWIQHAQVWGLFPKQIDGTTPAAPEDAEWIEVCMEGKPSLLAKRILIATGAYDRLAAFPGWQTPGVMSAGGIQLFLKSQGVMPGENIALAGSHPFIFIVAQQILKAGGKIAGIAFAQTIPQVHELIRYGLKSLTRVKKIRELLSAYRLIRKAGVPILFGCVPTRAEGGESLRAVSFTRLDNKMSIRLDDTTTLPCDVLGMCFGFNASSELSRQIGCDMTYTLHKGGWIAGHTAVMQSSLPRVYVAGEVTGIGGAELSELEGRLAGCGVLEASGMQSTNLTAKRTKLIKETKSWNSFADMLNEATALPSSLYHDLLHEPQTYICKCEQVTTAQVSETIEQHPYLESLNTIKLHTRCGMGLCQGRYCENTLTSYLEHRAPDKTTLHGNFTTRHPVKPINIRELIQ